MLNLVTPSDFSGDLPIPGSDTLNAEQRAAVHLALTGKPFCLIGPAGTGKTLTIKFILLALIAVKLRQIGYPTKVLPNDALNAVVLAYTRRASANVRKGLPPQIYAATFHALLEYEPAMRLTQTLGRTLEYRPSRNKGNPLPRLETVVVDEATLQPRQLEDALLAALPRPPQMIYVGDLAQLPPVASSPTLGYHLLDLPVVELTQVYRNDSDILDFATRIREGDSHAPYYEYDKAKVEILERPYIRSIQEAGNEVIKHIYRMLQVGSLDLSPEGEDLVLCPYNVGLGTMVLNSYIAAYYDIMQKRTVWQVNCAPDFTKTLGPLRYYAVGDRVQYEQRDYVISDLQHNDLYFGEPVNLPSPFLDRWGRSKKPGEYVVRSIDPLNLPPSKSRDGAQSSIMMSLIPQGEGSEIMLNLSKDISRVQLGYATSVHRAQGSQANHVVCLFSRHHGRLLTREVLYTGVTRAQNKVTVITEPDVLVRMINSPQIKGDTLQEKAKFFFEKRKEENESI